MWRLKPSSFFSIILLISVLVAMMNCQLAEEEKEDVVQRSKRSYYGGYDMYGDDYWYAGRIIGLIVGICLLLCCCCLPCVCIAGIWFAGWFGLRNRNQKKNVQQVSSPIIAQSPPAPIPPPNANYDMPGNANYIPNTQYRQQSQQPRQVIHVDSSPRDSEISRVMVPGDQVIFSAEDRYYTSSTAPAPNHRPGGYNVSRY